MSVYCAFAVLLSWPRKKKKKRRKKKCSARNGHGTETRTRRRRRSCRGNRLGWEQKLVPILLLIFLAAQWTGPLNSSGL